MRRTRPSHSVHDLQWGNHEGGLQLLPTTLLRAHGELTIRLADWRGGIESGAGALQDQMIAPCIQESKEEHLSASRSFGLLSRRDSYSGADDWSRPPGGCSMAWGRFSYGADHFAASRVLEFLGFTLARDGSPDECDDETAEDGEKPRAQVEE